MAAVFVVVVVVEAGVVVVLVVVVVALGVGPVRETVGRLLLLLGPLVTVRPANGRLTLGPTVGLAVVAGPEVGEGEGEGEGEDEAGVKLVSLPGVRVAFVVAEVAVVVALAAVVAGAGCFAGPSLVPHCSQKAVEGSHTVLHEGHFLSVAALAGAAFAAAEPAVVAATEVAAAVEVAAEVVVAGRAALPEKGGGGGALLALLLLLVLVVVFLAALAATEVLTVGRGCWGTEKEKRGPAARGWILEPHFSQ